MYQVETKVNYWQIYQDLIAKDEYPKEDIGNICEEVYRIELLHAMGFSSHEESCKENAWDAPMQEVEAQLLACPTFSSWLVSLVFPYLFSWELFHLFHPLLVAYFSQHQLPSSSQLEEISKIYLESGFPPVPLRA